METTPKVTVATVGVRNRRCIFLKTSGSALCTDIESTVRAVGKIVVWVEAAAEERTIKSKR